MESKEEGTEYAYKYRACQITSLLENYRNKINIQEKIIPYKNSSNDQNKYKNTFKDYQERSLIFEERMNKRSRKQNKFIKNITMKNHFSNPPLCCTNKSMDTSEIAQFINSNINLNLHFNNPNQFLTLNFCEKIPINLKTIDNTENLIKNSPDSTFVLPVS